jgi:hypothetical protein
LRDGNQVAPIFLQFLDAVWQLCHTFPTHFEFNARYLLCIAEHLTSCRFGTFLVSCERDRQEAALPTKTVSIWSYLRLNRPSFESLAYQKKLPGLRMVSNPKEGTFLPPVSLLLRSVTLWDDWFLRWSPNPSFTHQPFVSTPTKRTGTLTENLSDDHDADTSGCAPGDLQLTEATLKSADWEAIISSTTEEAEKWRVKALSGTMRMMQASETGEKVEEASGSREDTFDDLDSANVEILRLRALVKEQDKKLGVLKQELTTSEEQRVVAQAELHSAHEPTEKP